jgi:hypothetical protein
VEFQILCRFESNEICRPYCCYATHTIHTHTHTSTPFFWFPVPHKIDTGNLCLLYLHIAISFKICMLTTSARTSSTTTTTLLWMLHQIIMKLQSVEIKSCLLASRVVNSLHPTHSWYARETLLLLLLLLLVFQLHKVFLYDWRYDWL